MLLYYYIRYIISLSCIISFYVLLFNYDFIYLLFIVSIICPTCLKYVSRIFNRNATHNRALFAPRHAHILHLNTFLLLPNVFCRIGISFVDIFLQFPFFNLGAIFLHFV